MVKLNYASALALPSSEARFSAACGGECEHNKNVQSIDDWLRRAKGSSRLDARRVKFSFFFLVLMLSCSVSMGQAKIGAFAGLNRSKLSGDAPVDGTYKNLMGGNFGAILDVKLGKTLYLSLQPSFSQEGTKITYHVKGEPEPVDSIKIRLKYFSLPILLKVTSSNQRFYALSGFETGMLLNNSMDVGDQTGQDFESDIAQMNFAMHFGAGILIPVGFPSLFVELRYSQGLVNITNKPLNSSVIPRVKTTGFKILFGIGIPLSKSKP